jgi:NDP-sugar pyrophosphorylase family protein
MKAIIFAAGLGTRLGKITENIPKALLQLNGKTVLHHAVKKCRDHGFDDVIINVHHFADKVLGEVEMLKKLGYRIEVSDESGGLLETGGGLYKARDFFDSGPFLIFNVDIVTSFDLGALYRYHLMKKGLATLAVRHRPGKRFYLIDSEGIIRGWRNKITGEQILAVTDASELSEIAFSGMHIVDPEIFNYMTEGVYTMTNLYLKLATDFNIYTLLDDGGYWFDIGTPTSLEKAREIIKEHNS